MEELLELRRSIEDGNYSDALQIIDEMTDMAKKATLNQISSFVQLLLAHLIKQRVEQRTTRSWTRTIRNALIEIRATNERLAGGFYAQPEELQQIIDQRLTAAAADAADEVFEGKYTTRELFRLIDAEAVKAEALNYILNGLPESEE